MTNSNTKMLLEMSKTFEQADAVLSKTWCKTDADRVEYLKQIFPELSDLAKEDDPEDACRTILSAVIHGNTNESYQCGYRDGYATGNTDGYTEAARHVINSWEELRKLSKEGIREHFSRILHKDMDAEEVWR